MSDRQLNFGISLTATGGAATAAEAEKVKTSLAGIGTAAKQSNREIEQSSRDAISQIAEMSGATGEMASVLRSVPVVYAAIAVSVGVVAKAYADGAAEINAMNIAIGRGGDISGQSAASLRALSADLATHSQLTIAQSKNVAIALAESGRIGEAAFWKITRMAGDYAKVMGTDVAKLGPELVKIFSDPVKGAETLNQQLHFLSAAEMDHIEHLTRIGNVTAAQIELEEKLGNTLDRIKPKLGAIEQAWNAAKGAASAAWDGMMGIGREESLTDRLDKVYKRIKDVQAMGDGARNLPSNKQLPALMQEAMRLEEQRDAQSSDRLKASVAAEQNRNDMVVKGLRDQLTLKYRIKEIDDQIALAKKSSRSVADTDLLVAALEDKKAKLLTPKKQPKEKGYEDASVEANKNYAKAIEDLVGIQAKAISSEKDLTAAEQVRQQLITSGAWEQLASATRAVVDAYVEEANATIRSADSKKIWVEASNAAVRVSERAIASLEDAARAAEDEVRYHGMTKSAIEQTIIARLEEQRAMAVSADSQEQEVARLDREIELRKRLAGAALSKEGKDKAERDSVDMWQSIERAAHDTWTAVNRDGESVFKSLGRTLRSAVLDVLYQMTVKRWIIDIAANMSGSGVAEKALGSASSGVAEKALGSLSSGVAEKALGSLSSGWAGEAVGSAFKWIKSLLPGFATGGSFTVGGAGGTDSQLVAFRATPGEMVNVRTPAQQGGGGSVSISVAVDASGSSVAGDGAQAGELGRRVAASIRAVLIDEKRPGGLLAM